MTKSAPVEAARKLAVINRIGGERAFYDRLRRMGIFDLEFEWEADIITTTNFSDVEN